MIRPSALAIAFLLPLQAFAECREDVVDLRGDFGQARFRVEIADTPAERSRGLMFREDMPRMGGMLFVYEAPTDPVFWMKNTPLPLDILFFDPAGRLSTIQANAIPFDVTGLPGGPNIQYVLEIHAGLAAQLGIEEGAELRHPSLGQDALWGCD